jgi:hypothetical protein
MTRLIPSWPAICIGLLLALALPANGPFAAPPVAARPLRAESLPIAIYRNIGFEELKRLLVGAFTESGFALVDARKVPEALVQLEFRYPANAKDARVDWWFKVDGTLAGGKCANCFLRWGRLHGEHTVGDLPWMEQYDFSSRFYPDLDRAYALVRSRSEAFLDPQRGFAYQNTWNGERNRLPYSNSFAGVRLPDLKREIIRAWSDAGFVFLHDSNPAADAPASSLSFEFPIEPGGRQGAAYAIRFSSQFDAAGNCFPCETTASFDPHQPLPSLGLSGVGSRLTLAPRFESSLKDAYDRMQAATQQHLRPRTQFVRPPRTAALGSPRPPPLPPAPPT